MSVAIAPKAAKGQAAPTTTRPQAGSRPPARLQGADALRAAAALAVVAVHAVPWALQDEGGDRATWSSLTLLVRFCVPAFVLLTGLVLAYRYGDQRLGRAFLWRRARRTVLPFAIWAPIFCVADLLYVGTLTPQAGAIRDFWLSGAGHLYFLLLVPQFYLLLMLWPAGRRAAVRVAVAAVVVQTALQVVRLLVPMPGALSPLVLGHGFLEFPFWIGYFAAGVALGRLLAARRGRGWPTAPFALAVPVAAAALLWVDISGAENAAYGQGTGAFLRPLVLPLTLAVCGALLFGAPRLLRHMPRTEGAVSLVSRHSLGIYIVHPLLLTVFGRMLFSHLHTHVPQSIWAVTVLIAATFVAALVVSNLLARTPLAVTIGEERIRRRPPGDADRELVGRRAETPVREEAGASPDPSGARSR